MRVKGFRPLHPPPDRVGDVSCVPYDTVNTEEARALAAGKPDSFLHVSRPEIDFPAGTDMYADACYEHARKEFGRLQASGALVRHDAEALFVYSIRMGRHEQTGIVAGCHVSDYESGLIKRHEKTRADKVNDRLRHIRELRAHPGPVFLAYRNVDEIDALVRETMKHPPLLSADFPGGTTHRVWAVKESGALAGALRSRVPASYIADGHHRAAAAAMAAGEFRARNPAHTGEEEYNWFMAVMFPSNQLRVMPYNRVVADLNGMSPEAFLAAVSARFRVARQAEAEPASPHRISMYLGGQWYGLSWDDAAGADPVSALDVSILQDRVLGPLLGIDSPMNPRIEFVGGIRGIGALTDPVDQGTAAVSFSMHPVSVDEIMVIADGGQIMPAKSTWFEPKLRSALLIHTF